MPNADTRVAVPSGERQYHIGLGPGELADYILLPGDQDRVARVAVALRLRRAHPPPPRVRECDRHLQGPARLVRVDRHRHGQRRDRHRRDPGDHRASDLHPGRLLRRPPARHGARRPGHLHRRRPARDDDELVRPRGVSRRSPTTRRSSRSSRPRSGSGIGTTSGITATAPGFYGAQGRPIPQLPIRYPDLADEMTRQRVLNFEMEASALLVLAGLAGCRAGVVCAVYANRRTGAVRRGRRSRTRRKPP